MLDKKYWQSDKASTIKEHANFLKIDVDYNSRLASNFNVKGIPDVVVADILGNKIWHSVGSRSIQLHKMLKALPQSVEPVNITALPFLTNKEKPIDYINLGKAYQNVAFGVENITPKNSFLSVI